MRPMDIVRWAAAITLMWASVEKGAYPEWSFPLFADNPSMTLGYDPEFLHVGGRGNRVYPRLERPTLTPLNDGL